MSHLLPHSYYNGQHTLGYGHDQLNTSVDPHEIQPCCRKENIYLQAVLDSKIDLNTPNPFTVDPKYTNWCTNDLILKTPGLRVAAGVSPEDIGLKQATVSQSPLHLDLGI